MTVILVLLTVAAIVPEKATPSSTLPMLTTFTRMPLHCSPDGGAHEPRDCAAHAQ
ncbi:MAG: hypothetical protein AAF264_12890 [Pseudomonadota bacterium]